MSHMETFGSSLHMNTHTICTTLEHTHPVPTNEIQSPVMGGGPSHAKRVGIQVKDLELSGTLEYGCVYN